MIRMWWRWKMTELSRGKPCSYGTGGRSVHSRPDAAYSAARRLSPCLVVAAFILAVVAVFVGPAGRSFAAEKTIKIVALGDSLTAGYGLPNQDAFPTQLERALRAKGIAVEITNAGVSGDTASGGLSRLDWSVPDGTDAVIVALGANDMLRGVDPAVTRAALDSILQRLKQRRIEVLFAGMQSARNMGTEYRGAYDSIFPDLATKHGVVFYPFLLEGIAAQTKFSLADGIHPNAAGVSQIVTGILPKAEELIARVRSRRAS